MSDLGDLIRAAVAAGSQVHVWPAMGGGGSATVRAQGGVHHVERSGPDPVQALTAALVEEDRLRREGRRLERVGRDFRQMDIEDAIDDEGCVICENGGQGCDACRPAVSGIEDMIG